MSEGRDAHGRVLFENLPVGSLVLSKQTSDLLGANRRLNVDYGPESYSNTASKCKKKKARLGSFDERPVIGLTDFLVLA